MCMLRRGRDGAARLTSVPTNTSLGRAPGLGSAAPRRFGQQRFGQWRSRAQGAVRPAFGSPRLAERARYARITSVCGMTLARSTERLETERLVLRRVVLGDLPFYVRIHGTPEVAQGLWPEGRPRTAEQT